MPQRLGQHFLRDGLVLEDLLSEIRKSPQQLVVEIGSGTGALTERILQVGRSLLAVEWDERLATSLEGALDHSKRFAVINADIRRLDIINEIDKRFNQVPDYLLVGNLPYYLTSFLLRQIFSTWRILPKKIIFIIQKEVAERIIAKPGSKNRSVLSVLVQSNAEPLITRFIGPESFSPPPKVESAIIVLDHIFSRLPDGINERQFSRLVRFGFASKRKTILNTLSAGFNKSKNELIPLLENSGVDSNARAEDLSQENWYALAKQVYLS